VAEAVDPPAGDPAGLVDAVERRVSALLDDHKLVITLGGDHTVAVGAGRAHAARHEELTFLQIDAHADLRDTYEGSPYSHACAARRLSEVGEVVQVGIRSISTEGSAHLRTLGRAPFWARDIASSPDDGWMDEVVAQLGPTVYVTFDVDGLDPSIMPATGTPERRVVGADVCELLPTPGLHACDVLVARLVYKMIGYFVPTP
jgi:agmatinase